VILHVHSVREPGERVVQLIPQKNGNDNGMF
jgi:hypothetical protein